LGTRAFLFLIFLLFSYEAFACGQCHQPHYSGYGDCSVCHRGEIRSSRENVAHSGLITAKFAAFYTDKKAVSEGDKLAYESACRRCHRIGAEGEGAAADLNASAAKNTGEYLYDKIKNVNEYMPDFRFSDVERRKIILYLLNESSKGSKKASEPYVAYITSSGKGAFEKNCGGCHRMLTRKGGGRGTGSEAANLSGLFSVHFRSQVLPANEKQWTEKRLAEWIRNPRSIKKNSVMPPVRVDDVNISQVIKELKAN